MILLQKSPRIEIMELTMRIMSLLFSKIGGHFSEDNMFLSRRYF